MTDETAAAAAPGWYDDGSGRQRYWDGTAWTDQYSVPVAAAPARRKVWPWLVAGGGVLALILIAVVVVIAVVLPLTAGPDAVVKKYNDAWFTGNCQEFIDSTTQALRDGFTSSDDEPFSCSTFGSTAADYYEGTSGLGILVTSVEASGGTATVNATETGTGTDGSYSNLWVYTLVKDGTHWLVDSETLQGE